MNSASRGESTSISQNSSSACACAELNQPLKPVEENSVIRMQPDKCRLGVCGDKRPNRDRWGRLHPPTPASAKQQAKRLRCRRATPLVRFTGNLSALEFDGSTAKTYFSVPDLRPCSTSSFCKSANDLAWPALSIVFSAISCTF